MRSNGQVTAALLLVALAAVGCGKGKDNSQTEAQDSWDPAQAKPVAAQSESSIFKGTDEEGVDEASATKITGPVSFADAEAAYQARNYSEAAKLFERYTGQRPDNVWGHFMLGLSAWKGGDLEKAEKAFDAALGIDPDHFKSLVNLSRVLLDVNRADDALDRLMRAGDIDPNSTDVHRLLGRAYHVKGQTDEAAAAYRRAIELDGTDAWSMNNLGLLFLEQKRAEEALPLLAKAVTLRQDVPAFHNNLGMALEHTGRFAAAAAAYGGALTADSSYEKARQNLARVDKVKGEGEEPFDLEATAKIVVGTKTAGEEAKALDEETKAVGEDTIAGR